MKNTVLSTYHYDPLNRLTGINSALKPANQRFYCNKRLVTEIQGTVQHSYIQGAHQLLAQQTHDGDQHNSVLFATDRQRSVLKILNTHDIQSAAYTPYGHRRVEHNSSTLLGFNGERIEPATEHYLLGNGYRAFNPVLMRFNSPDSWSPFGAGSFNAYAYCNNDPINKVDPSGHASFLFLAARLVIWSRRAQARLIERTGRIYLSTIPNPSSRAVLNSGITPTAAVTARARIFKNYELGYRDSFMKNRHLQNLQAARNESLNLKNKALIIINANKIPMKTMPASLKKSAQASPTYDRHRMLENINADTLKPEFHSHPAHYEHARNYEQTLRNEGEQNHWRFEAESAHIRDVNFTQEPE